MNLCLPSGGQKAKGTTSIGGRSLKGGDAEKPQLPYRSVSVARSERGSDNINEENPEIIHSASCPSVTGKGKSVNHTSKSKSREYPLSLKIWLDVFVEDNTFSIRALVDTGAEMKIKKRGIIPHKYLQKDSNPLVLRGE